MSLVLVGLLSAGWATSTYAAAPRIDMTLGTEPGFPATSMQQWYQLLTALGVDNLQIRSAAPADKLEIQSTGTPTAPSYKVVGRLTPGGEMIVPGGRFPLRDRAGMNAWLDKLRTEGPERAAGAPRTPFGLPIESLEKVHDDLARTVDFATKETPLKATLEKIAGKLAYPLLADGNVTRSLAAAGKIEDELQGLSAGAALAVLLRQAGMVFVPRFNAQRTPEYLIVTSGAATESWPIGWPPSKPLTAIAPKMLDQLKIEIEEIPVSQVVEALAGRLELPIIYDRAAMRQQQIDPTTKILSLPANERTYAKVLEAVLFRAQLKYQLRIDEAGKPWLWITTLKSK
jgi:hypothetical protein